MARFLISNRRSGADLGVYEGETEAEALDAMARDAGYDSFAGMAETLDSSVEDARDDLVIEAV